MRAQQRRARRRRQLVAGALALAVVVPLVAVLSQAGDGGEDSPRPRDEETTTPPTAAPVAGSERITGDTPCPPPDGSARRVSEFAKPPPLCLDPARTYVARFTTTEGVVEATLDTANTPVTANNFVVLARYHYYDGTALFRTNTGIAIIQGGSPHTQGNDDPGPGYTIPDEGDAARRTYAPGDLVMARSSAPNSASAQFFFGAGPAVSGLDAGGSPGGGTYVTFGKVTSGLDVLERILALHQGTADGPDEGAPRRLVTVRTVEIVER